MRWLEKTWENPTLVTALLAPLSGLYWLGWGAYQATYDLGLKRAKSLHHPILCIGNLRVGGMGKTPLTLHILDILQALELKVVVSQSAYGSPASEMATLAPEGPLNPARWGDEPAMLRWLMPEVPIICGRNRVRAAEIAAVEFPDHVLLLDDGAQHLPLAKDILILLDPSVASNPLCLPAGPYRQHRSARNRAALVLPGQFQIEQSGTIFIDPTNPHQTQLKPKEAEPIHLLTAIARPERLMDALRTEGITLQSTSILPDHDPLSSPTLVSDIPSACTIITTAKDWVKLRERPDAAARRWIIATYNVRVTPEDEFRDWLNRKINEATP